MFQSRRGPGVLVVSERTGAPFDVSVSERSVIPFDIDSSVSERTVGPSSIGEDKPT